jgi:hypothetical protein
MQVKKHTVKPGEVLSDIARQYGFKDGGKRIIDANPRLADDLKKNGNVLREGWVLNVPDVEKQDKGAATAQRHTFAIPAKKKNLRIVLQDPSGKPVEDWKYHLTVSGKEVKGGKGTTGSNGRIDAKEIPQPATQGALELRETELFGKYEHRPEKVALHIGGLTPIVDTTDVSLKAVQKMLLNLGYYKGKVDGVYQDETRAALREFQEDRGIEPATGFADQKTCEALVKAQGNLLNTPKGPEKGSEGKGRDEPLQLGNKAKRKGENVTTRSEHLDPTWEDQTRRYTLGRFQFFPHEAYVAPADEGGGREERQRYPYARPQVSLF